MKRGLALRHPAIWLEWLLAFAVLAGLVRAIHHAFTYGYLPQPFFYEPSDLWMDWFNTAYWAHDPGAYDSWLTIYPPLSFAILKLFSKSSCYEGAEGLVVRDCDWIGVASLHGFYILNIILTAIAFARLDRRTAIPRSFALTAGLPMLYGLERGNLVLICFACMVLAYGPLVRSARLRWVFVGLAVNLKVYLIGALAAQLLRRRWRWFEGGLVATAGVYLVSYAIVGAGTPYEIYRNISEFSGGFIAASVLDIWYAGTYRSLISLLSGMGFPILGMIGSDLVELGGVILPASIYATQAAIVAAAAAIWLRPEVVPLHRVTYFGVAMALITAESGGYTQILMYLFVFMERWRGIGRPVALILCYVLCIPADIVVGYVPPLIRESYLSGGQVVVTHGIALGPFIRPLLIQLIAIALAAVTIRDVWQDIRANGWSTRWRHRGDAALLPGVQPPAGPDRA